jgi:signal transduction histidine kinase
VWGLYAPVRTRNELTGMLLLESRTPRPYSEVEDRRLQGLAAAAGLAVDNARWLERIHRVGVEQERSRIARELHDHVGQSMAYLGIELDRLVKMNHGRAVQHDLRVLRQDVRTLVQELRDTLVDLRTDVSEQRDVGAVIRSLADRVNRRGGVAVKCSLVAQSRLPIAVEREVWRIAQEAVINAEKHARATRIDITWLCNEHWALLEVTDDGVGLAPDASTVPGRYGLVGMRERADCIGADLTFESWPGKGTTVRLQIEQRAEQCAS